jgi:hypothetical protein
MDGTAGAATWCAWGVFAHNSLKLAHLAAEETARPSPSSLKREPPGPIGKSPPACAPPMPPPLPVA